MKISSGGTSSISHVHLYQDLFLRGDYDVIRYKCMILVHGVHVHNETSR